MRPRWTRWLLTTAVALAAQASSASAQDAGVADAGVTGAQVSAAPEADAGAAATDADAGTSADQAEASGDVASVGTRPTSEILHTPASVIDSSDPFLFFDVVSPDRAGAVVVRARPRGSRAHPTEVVATTTSRGMAARLPESLAVPPGIEYWVVERAHDGTETPVFASERDPHPVTVRDPGSEADDRRALADRGGNLSRVGVSGEWVDFGPRHLAGTPVDDHFYRLEASFTYAFLGNLEDISVFVGRVRGAGAQLAGGVATPIEIGIDYGRGSITWRIVPLVHVETSVLFGFSQSGFEYGGAGNIMVGDPAGASLTFGVEGLSSLGWTGRLRLAWLVVRRMPMAASVEVTTFPAGQDAGVRLEQEIGYVIYPGALVRLRAGYQARTSITGGLGLGG